MFRFHKIEKVGQWMRLQTIISILVKHGFAGIVHDLGWGGKNEPTELNGPSTPRRLRQACEELGPTFVKLAQVLSTRPDLLPPTFVHEFSKLTDQNTSFSFQEVLETISKDFGRDTYDLFEWIEEVPMAAASIAQVHRAKLRDSQEAVVIKVQRPGIEATIQSDIQVLHFIARAVEKLGEDFKLLNLPGIVKEFQRTIHEELDFTLEAQNIEKFKTNLQHHSDIVIPDVVWAYTSKRVLTMTEIRGTPLSQLQAFEPQIDRKKLAESIVTFFFESMFFHGFFHADAHPGNVLLVPSGSGKLGLLDFGMVGRLDLKFRDRLSKIFLAVVSRDFETLSATYSEIGQFGKRFSLTDFQSDIRDLLGPNLGKPLREIHIGQLLLDSTAIARRYQIRLPRDLIMFYRSLMTLESLGRKLDPDFEFLTYGKRFAQSLIRKRFSSDEILRDVLKTVEGLRTLGTEFPGQLQSLMRRLEQIEPPGSSTADESIREIRRQTRVFVVSLTAVTLIMAATLLSISAPNFNLLHTLWVGSAINIGILFYLVLRR